jgi:LDH2 family malate/lactate/ureidoglycolate dehydrogenase
MMRFPYQKLDAFTCAVLERLGVPTKEAQTVTAVLSQASLRGVDTHGIDLLPGYVQRLRSGMFNPKPQMKVIKESVATMVIDADQALGYISSVFGMEQAINKAQVAGVGWINVINSNHHGALAYYALMAAKQDMIGIVTTTTSSGMAPWGSREPLVGNNPVAFAVPCTEHEPVVLDMACSLLANGRVRLAKERDEPIPEGLSIDAHGNPNRDPLKSAALLPFGDYKGSGLAMVFGFLAGVLAGSPFTGYRQGRGGSGPSEIAHLLIAVDIAHFTAVEEFKASVDTTIKSWHQAKTRPGFDEVLVPGEREWRHFADRIQNGIPLHASLVAELHKLAEELKLEFPAPLEAVLVKK